MLFDQFQLESKVLLVYKVVVDDVCCDYCDITLGRHPLVLGHEICYPLFHVQLGLSSL